jgi:hypothetical protein
MKSLAMTLRHQAREVATALELALAALAPNSIIEPLASAAGLLTALQELPLESETLVVWARQAIERAERSLAAWQDWESERKVMA